MKSAVWLLALVAVCSELLAQAWPELVLLDGRILKEVAFVSQSPDSIMVRHAEGLAQIKKANLPAELQKQYPIDLLAAKRENRKQAAAKEELIRQKEVADSYARYDYEARRVAERTFRAEQAKAAAKVEAARQLARDRGELKGDLYIQKSLIRPRSVVLNVANIGENTATFDWREIETVTANGDRLPVTSAVPVDAGKRPDFTIDPKQARAFELVFGAFEMGNGQVLNQVRWKP